MLVDKIFAVNDRTDLQPVDVSFRLPCVVYRTGEFYLNRSAHLFLTCCQHEVHGLCQRIDIMLEDIVEGDHAPSFAEVVVAQNVVMIIKRGYHVSKGSCRCYILNRTFDYVESVVNAECFG